MRKLLLVFLCASSLADAAPAPEKVRLCVPRGRSEFMEILAVIGTEHGIFKKHNLDVEIKQTRKLNSGDWKVSGNVIEHADALDFRVADKVAALEDRCIFGASTVERFFGKGPSQSAVKPLFVSSFGDQYDTHLMVAKDSKWKSVSELKGQAIRIGQLPTYLATVHLFEAHGIAMNEIRVNQGNSGNQKFDALFKGEFAATTAYLPAMAYMLATDQVRILEANIIQKYLGRRIPHSLLVVNAEYAEANKAQVAAFQLAMKEAHAYLMRNREEVFFAFKKSIKKARKWPDAEVQANVQKAASFVGKVPFVDLTVAGKDRDEAYCDIANYASLLKARGIFAQPNKLNGWLGVSENSANSCKQNLASNR